MTLWSVAEAPAVTLVENFFKNLRAGKTKSEALQLARAQLRSEQYNHPFFWAPFILVGETR
jgi:CHAT domain-containing protein